MKRYFLTLILAISTMALSAQTLERMQWFNEPENWSIEDNTLTMDVTPQSDYWRISHYGFTVDDAPFLYTLRGGEFEVKVKISGEYKVRFDQAGLMLRIDKENYIKTGIEFVDGKYNLSAVVTHKTSDWSVIELDKPVEYVWIKAVRRLDAVEIFRENPGAVDLVLLDMIMPKCGGHQAFYQIRDLDPQAKILLSSGYVSESEVQDLLRQGACGFLSKPHRIATVAQAIRDALDSNSPA